MGSSIYIVFDDDNKPLYAFDNRHDLDYFLNGHDDEYDVRELGINETDGKRVLPCWEIRFDPDGKVSDSFKSHQMTWISRDNSVEVLDEKGDRLFVQAQTKDAAIMRAKDYRLNGV